MEAILALPEESRKELIDSKNMLDATRASVKLGLDHLTKIRASQEGLKEVTDSLKTLVEEQARIRTNIEKIPPTAEIYKRYLTKLDALETDLEKAQKKQVELTALLKKQSAEYQAFLKDLK
jgi:hypothetical protein